MYQGFEAALDAAVADGRIAGAVALITEREQRKAERAQGARPDPTLQEDRDRRGSELGHPGHQHHLARVERPIAAHRAEEHRHQVDRSEETHAQHEAQDAPHREAAAREGV